MEKILRYTIIALTVFVAIGLYELVQVYRTTGSDGVWRTLQWEQTDVKLGDLQPNTPDVPTINYGTPENKLFMQQPGYDTGTAYKVTDEILKKMEEDIRMSAPKITEAELVFKRAIYLKKLASVGFADVSPQGKKIIADVYEQLHYNMFRLPAIALNEDVNLRYIRRLYIHVLDFVYQGSRDAELFAASKFGEGDYFKNLLRTYGAENKDVVGVLYIDSLYSEQDLPNDALLVSHKMLALAQLFQQKKVKEDAALNKELYEKSVRLSKIYTTAAESTIHSSKPDNVVLPKYAYANALALMGLQNRTEITREQVNAAFADAYASLDSSVRSKDDILYWTKIRLQVAEVEYLFKQEANATDSARISTLLKDIASFREQMKGNKESVAWFNRYFTRMIRELEDPNKKTRPFILAARNDEKMNEILEELSR